MLIVNKTDLCNQYLGWVIDKIQERDIGGTHVEIQYLKKYIKFIFYERS